MRANLLTIICAATLFTAYGIAQPDFTPSQKVLINGPIAQGGTAIFQVFIGNIGTVPTSGTITVTDTGGTGLGSPTFSGAPVFICVGGTCTSPVGYSLANGSAAYIGLVSVPVSNTAPPTVTNTFTVSGGGGNTVTYTTAPIPVTPEPFLTITKTQVSPSYEGTPLPIAPGQTETYKLDVDNIGAGPTTGTITVTDTLASDMIVGSIGDGGGYWTCNYDYPSNTVTCTTTNIIPGATTHNGEAPNIYITAAVLGTSANDTATVTYTGLNGTQTASTTLSSSVQGTTAITFTSNQTKVEVDGEIYPSGITIVENTNLTHTLNAYPNCGITAVSGLTVLQTRPGTATPPWTSVTGDITASTVAVTCK